MADLKKTEAPTAAAPGASAAPAQSPEQVVATRIEDLEKQILAFKDKVQIIEGKIANRDPVQVNELQKQNKTLEARLEILENALYGLLNEALLPKQAEDCKTNAEALRQAGINYCKAAAIDSSIWSNLESSL